jgi:hypothetical protein
LTWTSAFLDLGERSDDSVLVSWQCYQYLVH